LLAGYTEHDEQHHAREDSADDGEDPSEGWCPHPIAAIERVAAIRDREAKQGVEVLGPVDVRKRWRRVASRSRTHVGVEKGIRECEEHRPRDEGQNEIREAQQYDDPLEVPEEHDLYRTCGYVPDKSAKDEGNEKQHREEGQESHRHAPHVDVLGHRGYHAPPGNIVGTLISHQRRRVGPFKSSPIERSGTGIPWLG